MTTKKKNIAIIITAVFLVAAIVALSVLYGVTKAELNKKELESLEIERKFLVDFDKLPQAMQDADILEIVQTYINFSPEMRIRNINNLYYFFTMKRPKDSIGLTREEIEFSITAEEYAELLTKQVGNTIYKTRYKFVDNGVTVEVDVYSHELSGLIVVEVEFPNIKESNAYKVPDWFGKDVTSDARYKNANLAKDGRPE